AVQAGNIGVVQWRLGDYESALTNYQIGLDAQREAGNASAVAIWLGNLGQLYADLHEDERALAYMDEAIRMHDQLGRQFYKIEVLLGKAALLLRRGDLPGAVQLLKQATDLATRNGNRTYLLDCDLLQAQVYVVLGRPAE